MPFIGQDSPMIGLLRSSVRASPTVFEGDAGASP